MKYRKNIKTHSRLTDYRNGSHLTLCKVHGFCFSRDSIALIQQPLQYSQVVLQHKASVLRGMTRFHRKLAYSNQTGLPLKAGVTRRDFSRLAIVNKQEFAVSSVYWFARLWEGCLACQSPAWSVLGPNSLAWSTSMALPTLAASIAVHRSSHSH